MHKQYFYLEQNQFLDAHSVFVKKQDAHHLINVLKKTKGDVVYGRTFDRKELSMVIENIKNNQVELRIIKSCPIAISHKQEIFCFLAIPKLSTLSSLLPKLSELDGVGCVPVITEKSFLQEKSRWNHQRFERIVNESFKQCGRNTPLKIYQPLLLSELSGIQREIGDFDKMDLFVPWEGENAHHILSVKLANNKIGYFIGPEGGLSHNEIGILDSLGFKSVTLGETVLKVETAVMTTLIYLKALEFLDNV